MQVLPTNWNEISVEEVPNYTPELSESVDVVQKRVTHYENIQTHEYTWKKFSLFEATVFSNGKTQFYILTPVIL